MEALWSITISVSIAIVAGVLALVTRFVRRRIDELERRVAVLERGALPSVSELADSI